MLKQGILPRVLHLKHVVGEHGILAEGDVAPGFGNVPVPGSGFEPLPVSVEDIKDMGVPQM